MKTISLPAAEIRSMAACIRAHPEYLDSDGLRTLFEGHCGQFIQDPRDPAVLLPIQRALTEAAPFSAIRIGDGEANLLTYGAYRDTPVLNEWAVHRILEIQADTFRPAPHEMVILRELMMGAIAQADLVGVRMRREGASDPEMMVAAFTLKPRGISGNWRAADYMLKLARMGWFRHKIVASAHLYFAVVEGLHTLLPAARRVLIVSNRASLVEKLTARYPGVPCDFIPVGEGPNNGTADFLARIDRALPDDLAGTLCLVGAGPWAEIYCSWIKQRGGVGVDVGSGLDLLDGAQTRPAHRKWAADKHDGYAL